MWEQALQTVQKVCEGEVPDFTGGVAASEGGWIAARCGLSCVGAGGL